MGMLRLVRAFTGHEKIVKFDGCYHGHADGFLVQAGSGVATLGLPDSPGNMSDTLFIAQARGNILLHIVTLERFNKKKFMFIEKSTLSFPKIKSSVRVFSCCVAHN